MTPFPTNPKEGALVAREDGRVYRYEGPPWHWTKFKEISEMPNQPLPIAEQVKLLKIAMPLMTLKDRLENHGFRVVKLQARVSTELANRTTTCEIYGIETEIIADGTLPPGIIKVAAMVQ
jgi:hypothetical protein